MNQKLLIRIIRLSKSILISYIRRGYVKLKLWALGKQIEQETKNAEEAIKTAEESVAAAEYMSDQFEREYAEYLERKSMRKATRQMLANSGSAEGRDSEAGSRDSSSEDSDQDPGQND